MQSVQYVFTLCSGVLIIQVMKTWFLKPVLPCKLYLQDNLATKMELFYKLAYEFLQSYLYILKGFALLH